LNHGSKLMKGFIASSLVLLNFVVWATFSFTLGVLKFIIPFRPWRRLCSRMAGLIGISWTFFNDGVTWLARLTTFDVQGLEGLNKNQSYLVVSNHQSWVDIYVLFHALSGKIPLLRFFLKRQLLWVPFLGLGCWGADMPFVHRYSKQDLEKRPELKGKDFVKTKKLCEKFKGLPVSILNFSEGSRSTPEKRAQQGSPYRHLLKPKSGGTAFVLGSMGDQLDALLDVTIVYQGGTKTIWEFLSGRVPKILVRIRALPIPPEFVGRDYMEDEAFREAFQAWMRDLWAQKDVQIDQTLKTT
jgi:1-acyl-sn-glycerol-3-phosphate acyltransferase